MEPYCEISPVRKQELRQDFQSNCDNLLQLLSQLNGYYEWNAPANEDVDNPSTLWMNISDGIREGPYTDRIRVNSQSRWTETLLNFHSPGFPTVEYCCAWVVEISKGAKGWVFTTQTVTVTSRIESTARDIEDHEVMLYMCELLTHLSLAFPE